jgi:alpha-glucosidase
METLAQAIEDTVTILEDEHWWSGVIHLGEQMPHQSDFQFDFEKSWSPNQLQSLLVSNKGRYIYCEAPFSYTISKDLIQLKGSSDFTVATSGGTLRSAYLAASQVHFPFSGKIPDSTLFSKPQYNTWIELTHNQNQEDVLKYARSMLDNGMPPGVLMIDDTWQEDYGVWDFHPGRFPDPHAMMDSLHDMGFKVMLWVCPFVSPDSKPYRLLKSRSFEAFVKEPDGREPKMVRWWNGVSAVLDLTNPKATAWFKDRLNYLQETYGVDGFKLDAGDTEFYKNATYFDPQVTVNDHCRLFAEIGLDYALNEYRACWQMGGQALAQRLWDKNHDWKDVQKLIPHMVLEGLMGYPYSCPDMIGGGEYINFKSIKTIDQELVVRAAQVHAVMPMMQFSVNPFRILDDEHQAAIQKAVQFKEKLAPLILDLAVNASKTGEPIIRHMEYEFPNQGFATVKDQFMLGSAYLMAPVVEKGAELRSVMLPQGEWEGFDGKTYEGGQKVIIEVGLETIPYFKKK